MCVHYNSSDNFSTVITSHQKIIGANDGIAFIFTQGYEAFLKWIITNYF